MTNKSHNITKAKIKRAAEVAQKLGMGVVIRPSGTIELTPIEIKPKPVVDNSPLF